MQFSLCSDISLQSYAIDKKSSFNNSIGTNHVQFNLTTIFFQIHIYFTWIAFHFNTFNSLCSSISFRSGNLLQTCSTVNFRNSKIYERELANHKWKIKSVSPYEKFSLIKHLSLSKWKPLERNEGLKFVQQIKRIPQLMESTNGYAIFPND